MIPDFNSDGLLPPGIHRSEWVEFECRFGHNGHRQRLLSGLRRVLLNLKRAGCREAFLDGSYVTRKELPDDYDGCWDTIGVDPFVLDPVLLEFSNFRAAQKAKYLGEMFPAQLPEGATGKRWIDFFQTDTDTGSPKGIVAIDLESVPDDQE